MVNTEQKTLKINESNLHCLILCALRYTLGRQTYMPSVIIQIVKDNLENLSDNTLQKIADEIGDYLIDESSLSDEELDKWFMCRADIIKYLDI